MGTASLTGARFGVPEGLDRFRLACAAVPAGASDHPLGGLGFANWVAELAEQERELGVFFDTVIVCSVTGSTHAGMIAGVALVPTRWSVRSVVLTDLRVEVGPAVTRPTPRSC